MILCKGNELGVWSGELGVGGEKKEFSFKP